MKKLSLISLSTLIFMIGASSIQAAEVCKASMMGRICYNEDGTLRGESSTPVEKKASADEDEKKKLAQNTAK